VSEPVSGTASSPASKDPTAIQPAPSAGRAPEPGPHPDTATPPADPAGAATTPESAGLTASAAGPRPRAPRPSAWVSTRSYLLDRRRRPAVVLCLIAAVGLIAFGVFAIVAGPPPTVEAVVVFRPEATDAQKEAVRAACPTVGNAVQEPRDANNLASTRAYPLRYNLTQADSADRAKVFECVQGQAGVVGITTETQGQ
jgi:hypothetical protein